MDSLYPGDSRERRACSVEARGGVEREGRRLIRRRKRRAILVVRDDARVEHDHLERLTDEVIAKVAVAHDAVFGDADHAVVAHNAEVDHLVDGVRRARVQANHHGLVRLVAIRGDATHFVADLRDGTFARGAGVPATACHCARHLARGRLDAFRVFKLHGRQVVRALDNLVNPARVGELCEVVVKRRVRVERERRRRQARVLEIAVDVELNRARVVHDHLESLTRDEDAGIELVHALLLESDLIAVAEHGVVDGRLAVARGRARQAKLQVPVVGAHAVAGNAANLVADFRDGARAVRASCPVVPALSTFEVALFAVRRHALRKSDPLDEIQVVRAFHGPLSRHRAHDRRSLS